LDSPVFVHTVLVDMRERLGQSEQPHRIFEAALQMATGAGLLGGKRVLDSTGLYDAVATQDTVTMIRAAIRRLLRRGGRAVGVVGVGAAHGAQTSGRLRRCGQADV